MDARTLQFEAHLVGDPKPPLGLLQSHRRERWGAACVAGLLSLLLLFAGLLNPLESSLGELRSRLLDRSPTGQVAIVEIDAKSVNTFKKWPWSRAYHADLVRKLHEEGASAIAFDVDFSAESDATGDQAFAAAIRDVQPVVLPIFQQTASDAGNGTMIKNRPAAVFQASWLGGVNIIPGPNGVIEDYPAATMIGGQIQPSLATLLTENDQTGDRRFVPDWSIDVRKIPRFSFVDVVKGRVPRAAIAGKRILVGATAIELGDRYAIPRFGTVPGVVIQALAAESLLQHRALSRSGWLLTIALLMPILLFLGWDYRKFTRDFTVALCLALALVMLMPLAVQWHWPLSIDSAALLVSLLIGAGARLGVELRHRGRLNMFRDQETGLPNGHALEASVQELDRDEILLIAASVDRFDRIRTSLGPACSTNVIEQLASRIVQVAAAPAYRISEDTLAWVVSNARDAEQVTKLLNDALRDPVKTSSAPVDVQLTFGLVPLDRNADCSTLIEQALSAVADARKQGRGREWFQGIDARAIRDLSIMGELRRAIADGQVFVAYQPKLDIASSKVTHAEALIRWRHPTEGMIPPDRFIPLAEETGIIRELTQFVMRAVVDDARALAASGHAPGISINVSAADIGQPTFAEDVVNQFRGSGLTPEQVTFEITESAILKSPETALAVLHTLRRYGFRLSVDDYGTGQSTLSYLKNLPVDELKIDKSFIMSIHTNVADQIMVRSTIEMAHELGLKVVAEGVQDPEALEMLAKLRCDFAQGFLIGQAGPIDQLRPTSSAQLKRVA